MLKKLVTSGDAQILEGPRDVDVHIYADGDHADIKIFSRTQRLFFWFIIIYYLINRFVIFIHEGPWQRDAKTHLARSLLFDVLRVKP